MRKYYGEKGSVTHNQVIIPKHLVPELLSILHGKTNKHTGITKMIPECRTKYYFPRLARKIRSWETSCPDCIANKRIDTSQIRPKMLSNTEFTMWPEDCLEVDILPNLPSSNEFQRIITMMHVFSSYLFAYSTQDMTARTVARCIIDVMTRHCYLPTVILTDKGSQFRSEVVNQIAQNARHTDKPCIDETCPDDRHTRKNTCLSEDSLKDVNGRKTLNLAQIRPNSSHELQSSYHERLGCEPTTVVTDELQKQIAEKHQAAKENLMQSFLKYKQYYDKKATATPLKVNDYCYVLNPKADSQSMKFAPLDWSIRSR